MICSKSHLLFRTGVSLAVFFACLSGVQAQTWTQIGNFPAISQFHCAYFWDTAHGVVGGDNCIYTYNAGTWTQSIYPEAPGLIQSLRLLDGVNLYAGSGQTCVWESTDRGVTWQKTTALLPHADDIYLGADGNVHGMNSPGFGMMVGTTFARRSALSCAAARDAPSSNSMLYSTDGGTTWLSSGSFPSGYTCEVDTCSGYFYTVSEDGDPGLYESTDGGITWVRTCDLSQYDPTDIFEGANMGVLYLQCPTGVLRSFQGADWTSIGGPGTNFGDHRMFSFGPDSRYLIAFDSGQVWLWSGGTLPIPNPIVSMSIQPSGCEFTHATLGLFWTGFEDTLHIHATATAGATIFPQDTTLVHATDSSTLPDSFPIVFQIQIPYGQDSATFSFDDSTWPGTACYPSMAWDTSFLFRNEPNKPTLVFPHTIEQSYCQPGIVPLIVTADSCNTFVIGSIQIHATGGTFAVEGPLPDSIAPNRRDTLWITDSVQQAGNFQATVSIAGASYPSAQNFDTTLSITIDNTGHEEITAITFPDSSHLPVCNDTSLPLAIQTSPCDTVRIDSIAFHATNGSFLLNPRPPELILPGTWDTFWVTPTDLSPGLHTFSVEVFGYIYSTGKRYDTVLSAAVKTGSAESIDVTFPDSTTLLVCNDTSLPLSILSLSCDTVRIDSIEFHASDGSFSLDHKPPDLLLSGKRDTFLVTPTNLSAGPHTVSIQVFGYVYASGKPYDTTLSVVMTISRGTRPFLTFTNTEKVLTCATSEFPLSILGSPCDTFQVDSITFQDTSQAYSLSPVPPATVFPGAEDTFLVSVDPSVPGSYFGTIQVYGHLNSSNMAVDTTFVIFYTAVPDRSVPRAVARNLSLSNCRESSIPIVLQADPCDSVEFTGCTFTWSSPVHYSSDLTLPLDLSPAGASDTTYLTIPPQSLSGVYILTAVIQGKYLGSTVTFDTTIQIRVTFISASNALAVTANGVNFDSVSICGEDSASVTFTNLGCDTINVTGDQTVWQPGWSVTDPAFPFPLAPDSSFTVEIHFKPVSLAPVNQTVIYGFNYPGGSSTSQFLLTGQAISVATSLVVSDTALNFGTFSQCVNPVADSALTITITNTGCDSLALSSASVYGGNGFALVNRNDTTLAPNGSASFTIYFADSLAGTWNSNFHIVGTGAHGGNTIDTTVSLTAIVTPGSRSAVINTTSINFGTTSTCEERDSSVTITNTGCEPVTITGSEFSSLQFADTNSFPIVLQPDSSATFPIFTHLDTAGHPDTIGGTLNFTMDSGVTVPSVTLTRSVTYPVAFSLSLASENSATIQAMVPVYVLLHGTIPSQATEVDFDLLYNDDLLSYTNVLQPDILPNGQPTVLNGITDRPLKMSPATNRDTIASIEFLTYLTKTDSTALQLSHQQFVAAGEISPVCIAIIDTNSQPNHFTLEFGCSDSIVVAALNDTLPFVIESIQPNPAHNEITISVVAGDPASLLQVQMYDALGREVTTPQPPPIPLRSIGGGVRLDVTNVPLGIYYLRFSSDGYVQTRSIAIRR